MHIGSLFSGIGGLELGLERAGLGAVVFQVESDPFCRSVLAAHWPQAQRFDDVRTVGASVLPSVDLLCGGFPCTDVSSAGKRAGLGTADNPTERSGLWYEFERIIGEILPAWVVVENVASGAARWLPRVRRALGARGYASVPLGISAAEVGARHRRERIFVVARLADADQRRLRNRADQPGRRLGTDGAGEADPGALAADLGLLGRGSTAEQARRGEHREGRRGSDRGCAPADAPSTRGGPLHPRSRRAGQGAPDPEWTPATDDDGERGLRIGEPARDADTSACASPDPRGSGLEDRQGERGDLGPMAGAAPVGDDGGVYPGFGLPPLPALVRGVYGFPAGLDGTTWRDAGWTPAKVRAARIKALGNSVVPACAEAVGRWILSQTAA